MATFETTWRYMFENAIAGRDIEVLHNDTWEPLSYINNHWTDENGKLYNLPDTIYYVINGKAMAAHESWGVDWRYVPSTPATNNGLINAMVEASIDIQQKAHALAMQEKQESRRVHVYLNNCLPGEFRASELAKKLKVSPRTVGRVAKEYGLKSDNGWYLWTKAKPAANRVYDAFELLMEQAKPGSFFSVQDVAAIAQTDDATVLECARVLGIHFDAQNIHEYSAPAPTPAQPDDTDDETDFLLEDEIGLCLDCGQYGDCACNELMELAKATITANEAAQSDEVLQSLSHDEIRDLWEQETGWCSYCGGFYCTCDDRDDAPYIDYLPEDWQGYTEWALGEQIANRHAINELIGLVL